MAQGELVKETLSSRNTLLQRFSSLHEYLCLIGEHINQIHSNLDRIDKDLSEMRNEHKLTIESEKTELQQIKAFMVTKTEVESLLQELNDIIKGAFPPLASIPQ